MIRWLGFACIVGGASSAGILMAAAVRRSYVQCRDTMNALAYMKSEIEFHLTPLGEITSHCAAMLPQPLKQAFQSVARDMHRMPGVPVGTLMRRALNARSAKISSELSGILSDLYDLLGKQDVLAQVRAIALAETRLQHEIAKIESEKKDRCKTYRTIGICTGLAVAVVLI